MQIQRIARRDKKDLSEQCKEREESCRMGKTRGLFKKIRDNKRTFHAKMGSIKDRNGMDLTFQVPMQHCSLQPWTLLSSPVTSTTGCFFLFCFVFYFGSVSSFSLDFQTIPKVKKCKRAKWLSDEALQIA